ncbi:aromatic amino acid hydroxylase [Rossellomorea sp. YZS02]|uniref:aromatic amino acid hydroxylase n=1 Tax=Rossellomorea sp. YZS02 TaxID=3097358 RepID=UPI002A168814|nr:aromatic amino acid hydroxylase [Rossellomorea sp. YZS02]MDX8343620.1 aromatic amino acid hydroxylase [Rossellomorea sp. YZS02]
MKQSIPSHLRPFVAKQHYHAYTPIDHAVWRYVMRQNHHFLEDTAHEAFTEGLKSSGINIEEIPKVSDMNRHLAKIGWGAAIVDGLIPGTAFFDFQAHGILPIATDIRQKSNIEYTPAPDILHEAAGHAPILFDETYSTFVKLIGNIGANAFATEEEHEVFEATRHLSIVMEDPNSADEEICEAKRLLAEKQAAVTGLSEAEQVSRIFWWTVEFGLIAGLHQPKIFGAGLLSSVGESKHCLSDSVSKRPFSIEEAIQTSYDVTSMQKQLFVCESFEQLIKMVEKFGETLAFRKGGTKAIEKAIRSNQIAHIEFNSGLQVTGVFKEVMKDELGKAIYVKTIGPTALSAQNEQLVHHGTDRHADGFGAPIGVLQGGTSLEYKTEADLKKLGIEVNKLMQITFESGIEVSGHVTDMVFHHGHIILLTIDECLVTYRDRVLFHPTWGAFDLAIGSEIVSARPYAADYDAFFDIKPSGDEDKDRESPSLTPLENLFAEVRELREVSFSIDLIHSVVGKLKVEFPEEWLLRLEILELLEEYEPESLIKQELLNELLELKKQDRFARLIENGLDVIYDRKGVTA